ncbi:hypothetical protein AH04_271 [Erwinia phage AH04]|uniref:Uncharacterized protein n=1 Tax=Erwinia phage AH04 TaxID=2869569 RepID=A0AAE7X0U4_9CAUD|nr:hypothetical protein PQC02_gp043 [Erwinia phage AH04]QZA70744.1 hypothetical protein AH04_271 [Erwinia phage AH04]
MTDIAGVQIPEGMKVDNVTFKESYTQARDEFGNGYIEFDIDGKIKTAEYTNTSYGSPPKDVKGYNKSIKNFTGILDLIDFTIIAVRGQLVFGFGCAVPEAMAMFTSFYSWGRIWEEMRGHFGSLKEEDIEAFESALNHFIKGLSKPLDEEIVSEDFIDQTNPFFSHYSGHMSSAAWMSHIHSVRELYQRGYVTDKDSYLEERWEGSFAKERTLPVIQGNKND